MISITTTGEKVNPIFRFQDIQQPQLYLNFLKGLQQHLDLKRPTRLQSIFLGLACASLFPPLIVQCPPTTEKIMCYVFTLLLHIKTAVKQPQGLCIVPNLEVGEQDLRMRTQSELPDTTASTCFNRPMRLRGDKTNMLFHQVVYFNPECDYARLGPFLVEAKKVLTPDKPLTAYCVCLVRLPNLTSSGLWSNWVMRSGWCAPRRSPSPRVVERDTLFLLLDDFCFAFCCFLGD
ncbi:putative RNA helicase [Helianthus annuus]|uniref:Putative P-loop containing nucleoside triphosphate hydrolase n=1 Tax=Helianthus annuus TaxID=4232 RepID=A0A251T1S5_HELAN|nr:uncharacterized protein LOC110894611 [Helianthus annuus]KAF5777503.1 putative RNA helicase [Helianthus annuus]KAJ0492713.1 putative RNA helicase [Helianthus annuus]KAJ0504906.1 putative RNA helicase [Helianthus annuus]KAJ0862311.1 putative RNA helicase [Helianthus annuus]